MTRMATISLGSRQIEIYAMSGEVMHSQKWTTTEVSGGGGSGVVSNGSGYVHTEEIKSKITTHDQLIIRTAEGEEEVMKVEDMHLAVRPGHWVSFIWAIVNGRKEGPYVALFNQNTGSLDFINNGVNKACFPFISSIVGAIAFFLALIGLFTCFVSSVVLGVVLMVPCAGYFYWLNKRRSAFVAEVSALRDQIKQSQGAPNPAQS